MEKSFCTDDEFQQVVQKQGLWEMHLFPTKLDEGLTAYVVANSKVEPTEEVIAESQKEKIEEIRKIKLAVTEYYDKASSINSFTVNGDANCWLDKATRVGLANSLSVETVSGKSESVLYLNGTAYTAGIETLQNMLRDIELYALGCYRTTERHKAELYALTDFYDIESYDITEGYPEKLSFTL